MMCVRAVIKNVSTDERARQSTNANELITELVSITNDNDKDEK